MTNTKNGSNQGMVPEARAAMDRFKMEAAAEVGVNLKQGYNGDIAAKDACKVEHDLSEETYSKMIAFAEKNHAE